MEEFEGGLKKLPGSILLVVTMFQKTGKAGDGLRVVQVRDIKALESTGAIHNRICDIAIDPGTRKSGGESRTENPDTFVLC